MACHNDSDLKGRFIVSLTSLPGNNNRVNFGWKIAGATEIYVSSVWPKADFKSIISSGKALWDSWNVLTMALCFNHLVDAFPHVVSLRSN